MPGIVAFVCDTQKGFTVVIIYLVWIAVQFACSHTVVVHQRDLSTNVHQHLCTVYRHCSRHLHPQSKYLSSPEAAERAGSLTAEFGWSYRQHTAERIVRKFANSSLTSARPGRQPRGRSADLSPARSWRSLPTSILSTHPCLKRKCFSYTLTALRLPRLGTVLSQRKKGLLAAGKQLCERLSCQVYMTQGIKRNIV